MTYEQAKRFVEAAKADGGTEISARPPEIYPQKTKGTEMPELAFMVFDAQYDSYHETSDLYHRLCKNSKEIANCLKIQYDEEKTTPELLSAIEEWTTSDSTDIGDMLKIHDTNLKVIAIASRAGYRITELKEVRVTAVKVDKKTVSIRS